MLNRRSIMTAIPAAALGTGLMTHASNSQPLASTKESPRQRIRLDDGWRFAFGHASDQNRDFGFGAFQNTFAKQGRSGAVPDSSTYNDSGWQKVQIPHDWAVELPFVNNETYVRNPSNKDDEDLAASHGYKPIGRNFPETSIGWYRRVIELDKTDSAKRLSLEFDGVYRNATIIFNGYIIKQHANGYTSFQVDITDFINTDDTPNTLLVRVDATIGEGWFYEGAGIYRHVWLVKTNAVHVPQWGVFVKSSIDGTISADVDLCNASEQTAEVKFEAIIYDQDNKPMVSATGSTLLNGWQQNTNKIDLNIKNPKLWSIEAPNLYRFEISTYVMNQITDRYDVKFGVREVRFDAQTGFYLNGQPLKFKGTNNHQDHAGVGSALPDALQTWRIKQLKSIGSNAYRASHNPPTPELLDACDRLGMLVIDETRQMTSSDDGLDDLEALIRRDRNHPSVILWSIGNEEPQQGTQRGGKIAAHMARRVRQLDPTRKIIAAMNRGQGEGITDALDVMGFNYHEANIEPFRKKYPNMPIIGTETASAVSTRGEYARDNARAVVSSYDVDYPYWGVTAETWWKFYNSKPYLSGGFVWTGFDYRGEPTPFNWWPSVASNFGIFDSCGIPKDIAHYYRSWWQDTPVLHLLPHWNWEGKEGTEIRVWAFSNLDEVELFINGKSCGRQAMPKDGHLEWGVPYSPGKLTAYGYKGGKVVLKDERRTAGQGHRLKLMSDRTVLAADGQDVAMVSVGIFDKNDTLVPNASNLIHFDISPNARLIGAGNGNPNSHESDKAKYRKAYNGYAQAIVQTSRTAGNFSLMAHSEGLLSASVQFKSIS